MRARIGPYVPTVAGLSSVVATESNRPGPIPPVASPTPKSALPAGRRHPYWLPPALTMLALGLWRLDEPELWRDELFTWSAITRPLPDAVRMLGEVDAVLGLYYLLMSGWTALFGTGVVALRLPSVLAMAVVAAIVARIGGELLSPRAGMLAGLVLCALPSASRAAQEARPYAFAMLAAAAATLLLGRALRRPSTGTWIWYAITLAVAGYVHLFAFTVVLGHAVAVVALTGFRKRSWVIAATAASVAVAPVALVGATQRAQVAHLPLTAPEMLYTYPETLVGSAVVAGIALAFAVPAAVRSPRIGWIAGALVVVPAVALFAVGGAVHVFAPRYLVFTLVGWVVLAGAGVARSKRPARWVSLALIFLLGIPAQREMRMAQGHSDHGAAAAARAITAQLRPDDGIVYEDVSWLRAAMDYYLPTDNRPRDVLLARSAAAVGGFVAVECADPPACLAGVSRLWVVHQDPYRPLRRMRPVKAAVIGTAYEQASRYRHGKLTVTVFTRVLR